jgi:predicted nucleotidyltransferase
MSSEREQAVLHMITAVMIRQAARLQGHRVVLFGSRAAQTARDRSDFDIGVLGDEPLPVQDFFAIEDELDDLPTLYKIDWVDLNKVSEAFRNRCLQTAEVIYRGEA